jgi:hypothetical protein
MSKVRGVEEEVRQMMARCAIFDVEHGTLMAQLQ